MKNCVVLMLLTVVISGCASAIPLNVKIDKIDKAEARRNFVKKIVDYESTRPIIGQNFRDMANLANTGEYKFIGARSSNDEKFISFLFQPDTNAYSPQGFAPLKFEKISKFLVFTFKFGDNPTIRIFQDGKLITAYVSDLVYCFGQSESEPIISESGGSTVFVPPYFCPIPEDKRKAWYFDFYNYETMKDFIQTFISAFDNVKLQ